jgi:hypothetical protein
MKAIFSPSFTIGDAHAHDTATTVAAKTIFFMFPPFDDFGKFTIHPP